MADTLTTITNRINPPPGQITAGGVLAGFVCKVLPSSHHLNVWQEEGTMDLMAFKASGRWALRTVFALFFVMVGLLLAWGGLCSG